jgi:acyl-CoA synthetase (AMP-forming)/AMP-acid ligase II
VTSFSLTHKPIYSYTAPSKRDFLSLNQLLKAAAGIDFKAFIDRLVSEDDLLVFCRERLAGYKCPKSVIFLEDFPRTTSGKIFKRKIRDRYTNEAY